MMKIQYHSWDRRFYEKLHNHIQKQPSRYVLSKRCYENMQQIYRRTPMLKCDFRKSCSEYMQQIYRRMPTPKCVFKKVAKQLHWNRTSAWELFCKFAACFQNTFSQEQLWTAASANTLCQSMKITVWLTH